MKQRILALALGLLTVLTLAGCGADRSVQAPAANMEALQQAMLAADSSLPEMRSISSADPDAEKNFPYLSDFSYDKLVGFLLSFSTTGTADELAVIQVKDQADASEAKSSLERHRQDRLNLFQTYGPKEAARVEKGLVIQSGPYAILIICDDADSVKATFDDYIHGLTGEG